MKLDTVMRNLRILIRTDRIITEIRIRHLLAKTGLAVLAATVGLFGLGMLNIAAFFLLEPGLGRILAAVVIGFADLLAAVLLMFAAGHLKTGRDLELAREIHAASADALMADAAALEEELGGLLSKLKHPFETSLPSLILPLATMILKALKKENSGG